MPESIRILPEQSERIETGVVKFGGDWPGVFIRGDNSLYFSMCLKLLLEGESSVIEKSILESLVRLLGSCDIDLLPKMN